jgi:hypothetical protein
VGGSMEQFIQQYTTQFVWILIWTLPWKAVALWKAAQRKDLGWYIALLLINTLGILEILYIFVFADLKKSK